MPYREYHHRPVFPGVDASRNFLATRFVYTRARLSFVAVGALAAEKRLFLNASRKRLLGALFGKKLCVINERLNTF